jgi:hypothetical protein
MRFYYEAARPDEIQLFGKTDKNILTELFMVKQRCTGGSTDLVEKELLKFWDDHPDVDTWIHSHPGFSSNFLSGTDYDNIVTLDDNMERGFYHIVMGAGLMVCWYKDGTLYKNIRWGITYPDNMSDLRDEINERVDKLLLAPALTKKEKKKQQKHQKTKHKHHKIVDKRQRASDSTHGGFTEEELQEYLDKKYDGDGDNFPHLGSSRLPFKDGNGEEWDGTTTVPDAHLLGPNATEKDMEEWWSKHGIAYAD